MWRQILAAIAGALLVATASAQTFPSRPVKIVVPYPAGTAADVATRRLGVEMSRTLQQPVVIENKPGAGGVVGSTVVAKSPPDGYTIMIGSIYTHALNAALFSSLPYDPLKDFVPVIPIISFPNVLAVRSSLEVSDMHQLLDLAKKRKQAPLTYASGGNGTSSHLSGVQLARLGGVELTHVPYQGAPAAITDLLAGRVDMFFGNLPVLLPHLKKGTLKAIAISSSARSPQLPNVPTMAELGLADVEIPGWIALFAPAGTPAAVVETLHRAARKALESPGVAEAYEKDGSTIEADQTPAAFANSLRVAYDKWIPVVKSSGARVE